MIHGMGEHKYQACGLPLVLCNQPNSYKSWAFECVATSQKYSEREWREEGETERICITTLAQMHHQLAADLRGKGQGHAMLTLFLRGSAPQYDSFGTQNSCSPRLPTDKWPFYEFTSVLSAPNSCSQRESLQCNGDCAHLPGHGA